MNLSWWRRNRAEKKVREISGEAQAFLAGKTAAWLDHHGRSVPQWAWVNSLARSNLDDLVSVDRLTWKKRASRQWATGFLLPLSEELAFRCRGDDRTLAELQRRFLWPLEHRLIKNSALTAKDFHQLAGLVRTALGWGAGQPAPRPGAYPAPPVGRGLGHGRINRIALSLLGPANVARRPLPRPFPPTTPPAPPES